MMEEDVWDRRAVRWSDRALFVFFGVGFISLIGIAISFGLYALVVELWSWRESGVPGTRMDQIVISGILVWLLATAFCIGASIYSNRRANKAQRARIEAQVAGRMS
jgi:hypothetical protein